jgi:hypothetical protein
MEDTLEAVRMLCRIAIESGDANAALDVMTVHDVQRAIDIVKQRRLGRHRDKRARTH